MSRNNPFCLSFGKEPDRYVPRADIISNVTETFTSLSPSSNAFLIMGTRGSGKTVLLTTIANSLKESDEWVVVSLNPARGLLSMLAAGLYESAKLQKYFIEASINLSKFGIGFNLKGNPPISDIQIAIEKMFDVIEKKGKRVLIVIDDVTKSDEMASFASSFQNLLMRESPAFLLMTGLYENVYLMERDKRCSFLLRTQKLLTTPLNRMGMANIYRQTFGCEKEQAIQMATFTKGYSYAFQALGYIMWNKDCSLEEAISDFDYYMSEYCYEKIWEDLSPTEKNIILFIAKNERASVADITSAVGINAKTYSVYRANLVKKGIIDGGEHGVVRMNLPRFDEYVKLQAILL